MAIDGFVINGIARDDDDLVGEHISDRIQGQAVDDTNDTLFGNLGADKFVISPDSGTDLIICADAGIVVTAYQDNSTGKMTVTKNGGGKFIEVILKPEITITDNSNLEKAQQLHHEAHQLCFIANSVNFPVLCQSLISLESNSST